MTMHKRWILQAFLLVISLNGLWRLTCYLVCLLPYELPSMVFTLCQIPLPEDFVFCPNYTPLLSTDPTPPYPLNTLPADDYSTLIDLKNFKFLNAPNCGANRSFLVAVVHSAPANVGKRRSIRSTWGTRIKTFFMVGETNSSENALKLNKEIVTYGDIVQGSFRDSYRNMTYKHTMSLKWVSYWCQKATYILKTDDDMFVHVSNLYKFLRQNISSLGARQLILCYRFKDFQVHRTFRSKWRMSMKEYSRSYFPISCQGAAIVYSPDAVFKLYSKVQRIPSIWIDDAHITGIVASLVNISTTHVGPLLQWEGTCGSMTQKRLLQEDLLFCHTFRPQHVKRLWLLHQSIQPSYGINGH